VSVREYCSAVENMFVSGKFSLRTLRSTAFHHSFRLA
jgi:hypothetical protein